MRSARRTALHSLAKVFKHARSQSTLSASGLPQLNYHGLRLDMCATLIRLIEVPPVSQETVSMAISSISMLILLDAFTTIPLPQGLDVQRELLALNIMAVRTFLCPHASLTSDCSCIHNRGCGVCSLNSSSDGACQGLG